MKQQPRIAVVGSFVMDLVVRAPRRPAPGETLIGDSLNRYPGGKGFNQAVAAARCGAAVSMIGCIGDDEYGREFRRVLRSERIDGKNIMISKRSGTGVAIPLVEPTGQNSIILIPRANRLLTVTHIRRARAVLSNCDVVLLQLEVPTEVSLEAARIARSGGALVILNPAPAAYCPEELLSIADFLVPNEIELGQLTGTPPGDLRQCLTSVRKLLDSLPHAPTATCHSISRSIIVTLAERGCLIVSPGGAVHIAGHRVRAIDTVGAGDAFCGALAVSLARGNSLTDAATFANAAGALSVTRPGAAPSMPRDAAIRRFLRAHPPKLSAL